MHAWPAGDAYPADVCIDDCALGDDIASDVVGICIVLDNVVDSCTDGLALLGITDINLVSGKESYCLGTGRLAVVLALVLIADVGELVLARDLGLALASVAVWTLQASAGGFAT